MNWLVHLFKGLRLHIKLETKGITDSELEDLIKHMVLFNYTKPFWMRIYWDFPDTVVERAHKCKVVPMAHT